MKTFNQFIFEELKLISNSTKSSTVYSGSKHDILKKSKHENSYSEKEFEVHEMMKKKPDLFCKILKNSKEQVLMEKLNVDKFKKFYNQILEDLKNDIYKYENFRRLISDEDDLEMTLDFLNSDESKEIDIIAKKFIQLKLKIYEYFKEWISNIDQSEYMCFLDLHAGNFGFIKGSKEIRCFDPIYIKQLTKN